MIDRNARMAILPLRDARKLPELQHWERLQEKLKQAREYMRKNNIQPRAVWS